MKRKVTKNHCISFLVLTNATSYAALVYNIFVLIYIDDHLLYIGGWAYKKEYKTYFSSVEFMSINNNSTCHIQSLDYELGYHASAVTPIGVITCGGRISKGRGRKECVRLTDKNTWKSFPSMNEARESFDLVVVGDFLVAFEPHEYTFEKINWRNGSQWELPIWKFNRAFYGSCVTKWDDENVLITGGRKLKSNVSNRYINLTIY